MLNPLLLSSKPLALNLGNRIAKVLKQITLNTINQSTQVLDLAKIDKYIRNQVVNLNK